MTALALVNRDTAADTAVDNLTLVVLANAPRLDDNTQTEAAIDDLPLAELLPSD